MRRRLLHHRKSPFSKEFGRVYATSAALTHLRAVDRHEMKLSIPVPVCNFAEFLPQTLDSILSQEGVGQGGTPMLSIFTELWQFIGARRKFVLVPIILMMALLGGLLVLTHGSAIAPFIYTIF